MCSSRSRVGRWCWGHAGPHKLPGQQPTASAGVLSTRVSSFEHVTTNSHTQRFVFSYHRTVCFTQIVPICMRRSSAPDSNTSMSPLKDVHFFLVRSFRKPNCYPRARFVMCVIATAQNIATLFRKTAHVTILWFTYTLWFLGIHGREWLTATVGQRSESCIVNCERYIVIIRLARQAVKTTGQYTV